MEELKILYDNSTKGFSESTESSIWFWDSYSRIMCWLKDDKHPKNLVLEDIDNGEPVDDDEPAIAEICRIRDSVEGEKHGDELHFKEAVNNAKLIVGLYNNFIEIYEELKKKENKENKEKKEKKESD